MKRARGGEIGRAVLMSADMLEFCYRRGIAKFDTLVRLAMTGKHYKGVVEEKMRWDVLIENKEEMLQLKTFEDVLFLYNNSVCRLCKKPYLYMTEEELRSYRGGLAGSVAVRDKSWLKHEHYETRVCEACYFERHSTNIIRGAVDWGPALCDAYPEFAKTLIEDLGIFPNRGRHIVPLRELFAKIVHSILYSGGYEYDQEYAKDVASMERKLVVLIETECIRLLNSAFINGEEDKHIVTNILNTFISSKLILVYAATQIEDTHGPSGIFNIK